MIPIVVLVAVVLHGNTRATEGKRNSDSCQDEMPMYGTAHMARLQIEESSQLTKGNSRRMKGLNAHIRNNPKVPLSHACQGLRDRRGSASCSLALSINSRGFCRENQSQFSSSVSLYSPFSFSILLYSLFCTRLYYCNTLVIPCLHYYIWRSQRDHRK